MPSFHPKHTCDQRQKKQLWSAKGAHKCKKWIWWEKPKGSGGHATKVTSHEGLMNMNMGMDMDIHEYNEHAYHEHGHGHT